MSILLRFSNPRADKNLKALKAQLVSNIWVMHESKVADLSTYSIYTKLETWRAALWDKSFGFVNTTLKIRRFLLYTISG